MMKMGYNLQLEQTQKLIMTPQLKQAIKILQLSSMELDQYIEQQLEKNPVLDIDREAVETLDTGKDLQQEKVKEIDWKEFAEDYDNYSHPRKTSYSSENDFNYENIISTGTTLQDHLLFQYHLSLLDKNYNDIGEYIIYSLDENGYLTVSVEEIAAELREDQSIVEQILQIIQTFDPPGVGARSLKECLKIQLNHLGVTCSKIHQIVEDFLEDVAQKKYPHIAKQMGITVQEVQKICDFIKTLEPKPGRKFSPSNHNYITPDAVIKKIGDEYVILVNDYSAPRLMIRDDYRKLLSSEGENSDTVKFLNDNFNAALWLIKSIEQRRQTIYRVVEIILKKQRNFFEYGKKYLTPMTLKEIADEIKVHESTVSRATNGKYVETPVGTFELKYFFSSGVEGMNGEGISAESIKSFISEIIAGENTEKPLSDSKIAEILIAKGIPISRRTVAKYRDDLGIPSSSKRKRY